MTKSSRGARVGLLLLALLPATSTLPKTPREQPALASPQVLLKDLFVAVQTEAIYQDGKTFVDAVPKAAPADILNQYHAEHPATPEALKRFTDEHFVLPAQASSAPSPPEQVAITTHIDRLWDQLTRRTPQVPPYSSALPLPKPYVVPGGRFREIYYWDSYFTMLGLAESGRQDLLTDMVDDFAYLIDTYGHIPNGARTYYLSRSQPPFFFAMVGLLSKKDAYARYLPQLRREYEFWMEGERALKPGEAHRHVVALPDGAILNRYWDDQDTPRDEAYREDVEVAHASGRSEKQVFRDLRAAAESGWDFGSRWFADGQNRASIDTTEIVPPDLNSLLFGLENAIQSGCEHKGDTACAKEFARRATARRQAMDRYLWDEARGAYLDYHWTDKSRIQRLSAATLYPLFFGVASPPQATAVAKVVEHELLQPGGIVTTTSRTGQQWDAPNGWAPLQWIAIDGLRRSGQTALAETIACRWLVNVQAVYRDTGKLVEKYDVMTIGRSGGGGEYPTQDGFGWTNGVMRKLLALYPTEATYTSASQCSASVTDPIMEPEVRTTLRQALPHAQVKIFPDLGHNPFWEDPRGSAAVLNNFLSSHE
jgi:alpha,alpha-trehalase